MCMFKMVMKLLWKICGGFTLQFFLLLLHVNYVLLIGFDKFSHTEIRSSVDSTVASKCSCLPNFTWPKFML